ncbi:MAG: bacteriohopanetetrol glucosamine biosynthesis glycosyltransferase HpnI [Deinococcales bacterium]
MIELVDWVVLGLTLAGWCFWLAAWVLAELFFRQPAEPAPDTPLPGVSVLKPLKGVDPEALANFESFCRQDYPHFQVLFGVSDPDDPMIPLVERLQQRHPDLDIQLHLLIESDGNPKATLLHQLASRASHDVLVTSDSDIRVPPDFLRSAAIPLSDPAVGLVTFPYRGTSPVTFTARLEALHMSGTFLPSALVGRRVLGMRFALGASTALRRRDLERLGGFAAVVPYLADDYQLGMRIARLGLRVRMSRTVVASVLGATSFREQWEREVRWARTTRVSRPLEYPGLLLTHTLPLAVALVPLTGATPLSLAVLGVSLVLRLAVAWRVTALAGGRDILRWLAWLPVRDLLSAAVWLVGLVGNRVTWRGRRYRVGVDGRLMATSGRRRPRADAATEVGTGDGSSEPESGRTAGPGAP